MAAMVMKAVNREQAEIEAAERAGIAESLNERTPVLA
jgi:hypothetical protein